MGTINQPNENSPLVPSNNQQQYLSSLPKTFANVFIAIVGAGVLGLPYTFKKTGWVFGMLMLFSVSVLTYHCMMLLVFTRRKLEQNNNFSDENTEFINNNNKMINSFGDLGFTVCGPIGRGLVDVMIVLSQAGFCVSYLIFIGNTLANVINSDVDKGLGVRGLSGGGVLGSGKIWGIKAKSFYIWSCFPFQLGLNSIPTLTHLAPLSIFADVVDIGAMGVVMVEDVLIFMKGMPVLQAFGGFSVVFYGLGVAVYAFEGIGMVLPLESETKDKAKFGRILGMSMCFISAMYAGFGILGYFAFGDETKDIVTTNFGKGLVSNLVQLGLCVNLFFTFPLMMNPVYEVVERRFCGGMYNVWSRWLMVLGVSLVALTVPNFADFLSLVGSSVCCILGFVLPSLFHYIVFKDEMKLLPMVLDIVIMVLGLIFAVSGTWSSLTEIFTVKV